MDPLSSVLALLKPRSHLSGRFDIGSEQAIRFPKYEGIKCYALLAGSCWLTMLDAEPVLLREGDCFLLPSGRAFSLATHPSARPVELQALLAALYSGLPGLCDGDPDCTLAGGHFLLGGDPADLLLGFLPPVVHLRTKDEKAAMRWSLERMRDELREERLGGSFLVQQLAYMMLVQSLRVHLAQASQEAVGWLYAMTDPQLKTAIVSMQANPANHWTVNGLAQHVGMSRSIFALKFKEKVGESPMEYLTRWRMLLAGDRLMTSPEPILSLALSLGYESESAFGKAFKRVIGCSPRQYSRGGNSRHSDIGETGTTR
ncbi:MAG: AraC family transcriptional regulator [Acidobacteriota bacterium]|nr:AraC family transcriptional regulator [Acidobacteriota bacterium]